MDYHGSVLCIIVVSVRGHVFHYRFREAFVPAVSQALALYKRRYLIPAILCDIYDKVCMRTETCSERYRNCRPYADNCRHTKSVFG